MIDPEKIEALKRTVAGVAVLAGFFLFLLVAAWNLFFHYVPPGKALVVISKTGEDLPPGQLLAKPGQKGPLEDVLGEGRHFVMPVLYEVELKDTVQIPPLKVGVVKSKVGKELLGGRILAEEGERGVRRALLPPGRHRVNPYACEVEVADAVVIRPSFVGFQTRLVGAEAKGRFALDGEKGILEEVLQPGIYYLNPYEYRVREVEVGLNQVSFLGKDQIRFPSKDAFDIHLDATVEWEFEPARVAQVIDEFGARKEIEDKVLIAQSRSIGRLEGSAYGAKDFLLGEGREKIQLSFEERLIKKCREKGIAIHSAYIRAIKIPEKLLAPIRESFVAKEMELTARVQEETKKSAAELERQQRLVEQRRQEVMFQTKALRAEIEADATRQVGSIEAETRRLVAEKQREIARLEAQTTELLGRAKADVERMLGEARAGLFKLKVGAFGGDERAFSRYAFAEALPPELKIHLVQTGEGTFWTDLRLATGQGLNELWAKQLTEQRRAQQQQQPPARPR
ncbi:MAG: SPFH domain-containing protein [Planctomycetota bacterium]